MIEVKFNEEKKIVVWKHIDVLIKEDIFSAIEMTKKIANKIKHLKIIELNDDVELGFSISDIPGLNVKTNQFEQFDTVKHAFVGNIPKNVAFFTVATDALLSNRYKARTFSLEETAYNWLLN